MAPLGCSVKVKSDLTRGAWVEGLVGLSHVTQAWNLITTFQLIALIYGTGDGRKVEVTHSFKRTGRKRCMERFSISLQIYKNKTKKKHIFQIKMTTSFIWQKVVYT